MPEKKTVERARRATRAGKSPSTAAGEFVREEIHHVREGKHGAGSTKQAIAIGLSKARRAGVKVPKPRRGSAKTRRAADRDEATGEGRRTPRAPSRARAKRSRAALAKAPRRTASRAALAKQARGAATKRTAAERSASARKGARTRARNAKARGGG
ncbi:MAG: DUF6496 domain-containing protein [Polyangiales bacterium]